MKKKTKIKQKKTKKTQEKKKSKLNIYSILFFIIFVWIIALSILSSRYQFNPIFVIVMIIITFIVLCILFKKVNEKFKNLSNKKSWIFYGITVVIMIALQITIGYLVRTDPSWDLGLVIQSAQEIIKHGHSTEMAVYYVQAENNIFITLLLALTIKLFSIFGITNVNISTLIVNTIFIQIAIVFLFKVAKRLFNNQIACFTLILAFLFLPFYPYATIMYTDTTSMFLPIAFLYIMIKIYDLKDTRKKYLYAVFMGILLFLSLSLKVTALIVVIAYIINEILNKRFKLLAKTLGVALLTFVILEVSYTTFLKKTEIMGIPYEETKQIPFTHFIMMGMYGTGEFSAEEWQFTLELPDYETRKEENIKVIKERLKEYGTQGYIKFLNDKAKDYTWGTGTYDFETILNSYQVDDNIAHEFLLKTGKYYRPVFYYCQIYHFTMLIAIAISVFYTIKRGEKNDILNIAKLSIFGLLIFLLLWETRSRYMLNFIPIYILIFVSGINYFHKDIKKFFKSILTKSNQEEITETQSQNI